MQSEADDARVFSPAYAAARRRRLHHLLLLLLCLMTLAVYANSFQSGFPLDNSRLILDDPRVKAVTGSNLGLILQHDYWYWTGSGLYRPVTTLSYLFNYAVLGNRDHAAGYHVVNLVLQWLNVALAYLLACQVFGDLGLAFATAALWSVHPLLTESVTNIVGRTDLLAGAAIMGGLLCYIHGASAREGRTRPGSTAALFGITTIGVFSKESVLVLPVLMAAYDFTFRRRPRADAYLAALAPVLFCWWARSHVLRPYTPPYIDNPLLGENFWTAKLTIAKVVGKYLWLLAFPRRLSPDYSYNQIPVVSWKFNSWGDWQALVALGACVLLLAAAMVSYGRHKPVFFFLVFSAVTYLPASNLLILIGSIMAERFMYLPALGFTACVAAGLVAAGRRLKSSALAPVAIGLLCVVFGCRAFARNRDWRNNETLATSAVIASPASFKTHMFLAMSLPVNTLAETDRAIAEIERAKDIIRGLPDLEKVAITYTNAGRLYWRKGDLLERGMAGGSEAWFAKSRDILLYGVHIDRTTNAYLLADQIRRGVQASRIPPRGLPDLYLQLGITLLRLHDPGGAVDALQHGLRLAPESAEFYGTLADAYGALDDDRDQVIIVLEGMIMLPRERRLPVYLAGLYRRMDTGGCQAVSGDARTGSLQVNLDCPAVREHVCAAQENLARLLVEVKREDYAQRLRERARSAAGCPAAQ